LTKKQNSIVEAITLLLVFFLGFCAVAAPTTEGDLNQDIA
jgi:hypothetical protein